MTQMIQKRISIDPDQDADLKKLAKQMGISQSELIRLAIRDYVNGNGVAPEKEKSNSSSNVWGEWGSREGMYEEALLERIDRRSARWRREVEKMESRRYVKLLGETETKFDRSGVYGDRIERLSD